jgi:nitronate monooxygenase
MSFGSGGSSSAKAWKDIWGCGQGIAAIKGVLTTQELVDSIESQYTLAKQRIMSA